MATVMVGDVVSVVGVVRALLLSGAAVLCAVVGATCLGLAAVLAVTRRGRAALVAGGVGLVAVAVAVAAALAVAQSGARRVSAALASAQEDVAAQATRDDDGCPDAGWFPDAVEFFEERTCLRVPASQPASVVFERDDYWLSDGSYVLVLDVGPATVEEWLVGPAPWTGEWQPGSGPVPGHASFDDGVGLLDEWLAVRSATTPVRHALLERPDAASGPDDLRNGNLVVLDPTTGRAWYAAWDS